MHIEAKNPICEAEEENLSFNSDATMGIKEHRVDR